MDEGIFDLLPDYEPSNLELGHKAGKAFVGNRIKNCGECGEAFGCYPEIHGWRIGDTLYCSYHCMRAAERRRLSHDKKQRRAEELEAEQRRRQAERARALEDTEKRIAECERQIERLKRTRRLCVRPGEKQANTKAVKRWKREHEAAMTRYEELLKNNE